MANARLRPYGKIPLLDGVDTARNLMIRNGFNLNSTSRQAWISVLGGLQYDGDKPELNLKLRYELGKSGATPSWMKTAKSLRNVFANHPQTAVYNQEEQTKDPRYSFITLEGTEETGKNYNKTFSFDSTDNWSKDRQHPAFYQSIRELEASKKEPLADQIIKELKSFHETNKHPPRSLFEFLDFGVLQKAIDGVPGINDRIGDIDDGIDRIPRHSSASVTQATLMNFLGKFAFVRSDTFTVRAAAEVRDPVSKKLQAVAGCSARLQRTPEPHAEKEFGRRFRIVDFSWELEAK